MKDRRKYLGSLAVLISVLCSSARLANAAASDVPLLKIAAVSIVPEYAEAMVNFAVLGAYGTPIADLCGFSCSCEFRWVNTQSENGDAVFVQQELTPVEAIGAWSVECSTPKAWSSLPNGTSVTLAIVPDVQNSNPFASTEFSLLVNH